MKGIQCCLVLRDSEDVRFCCLQLQVTMSVGLIWERTNSPLPRWNTVMSWDLGFKLPNNSRQTFNLRSRRHSNTCEVDYFLHRSERRELYRSIEGILDV
jgi:hypothetical protein